MRVHKFLDKLGPLHPITLFVQPIFTGYPIAQVKLLLFRFI